MVTFGCITTRGLEYSSAWSILLAKINCLPFSLEKLSGFCFCQLFLLKLGRNYNNLKYTNMVARNQLECLFILQHGLFTVILWEKACCPLPEPLWLIEDDGCILIEFFWASIWGLGWLQRSTTLLASFWFFCELFLVECWIIFRVCLWIVFVNYFLNYQLCWIVSKLFALSLQECWISLRFLLAY